MVLWSGGVLLVNVVAGLDVIDDCAPGMVCCRSRWPLLEDEGGGGRIGLTVSSSYGLYYCLNKIIYINRKY